MYQISPGETFAIRRQLDDPLDVNTYYVRAVLYWADTDDIIPNGGLSYVNLTDRGSQLFRTNVQVPADKNSGSGSRIAIKTTVYTDAAYTTVSDTYGIKEIEYLVFDRRNPFLGMGGGSGLTPDQVRKVVAAELAKLPQPEKINLKPVLSSIDDLKRTVKAIKIPQPEKLDLQPVLDQLDQTEAAVIASIGKIDIPEPIPTDLTPVTSRLDKLNPEVFHAKMEAMLDRVKQFLGPDIESIKTGIESINKMLTGWAGKVKSLLTFIAHDTTPDDATPQATDPGETFDDSDFPENGDQQQQ